MNPFEKVVFCEKAQNSRLIFNALQIAKANVTEDFKALQRRNKELEAQLKRETLRADFYDEMINVAEAKFNIPIRKKAGAKQ